MYLIACFTYPMFFVRRKPGTPYSVVVEIVVSKGNTQWLCFGFDHIHRVQYALF
jgi:hypothetical protein